MYILKTVAKSLTFKSVSELGSDVFTETREVNFFFVLYQIVLTSVDYIKLYVLW